MNIKKERFQEFTTSQGELNYSWVGVSRKAFEEIGHLSQDLKDELELTEESVEGGYLGQ